MFDMSGLSEFAKDVERLYGSVDEISEQLLEAGAPKVADLWRSAFDKNVMPRGTRQEYGRILRSGHVQRVKYLSRSNGTMKAAVSHNNKKSFADIYPKGYDDTQKTRRRNATKAFVLNYGRGKGGKLSNRGGMVAKNYVDGNNGINDKAVEVAIPAMQKELNKILEKKGLV